VKTVSVELAERKIIEALAHVPVVREVSVNNAPAMVKGPDLIIDLRTVGGDYSLIVEVKTETQPRMVPSIAAQLSRYRRDTERDHLLLFTDFVSKKSAELCQEYSLNYLDTLDNCRIALPSLFIEKTTSEQHKREKKELRSMFAMKSSRVLNAILSSDQNGPWKVSDLAETCDVSIGLVSKLKQKLIQEDYAYEDQSGLHLREPERLLLDWGAQYKRRIAARRSFYTLLKPEQRELALKGTAQQRHQVSLNGFSAAKWIAPYSRSNTETIYVDKDSEQVLISVLELQEIDSGANVILEHPRDSFVFSSSEIASNGISHTNAVQTYLDIRTFGERGEEAAEHLLKHTLLPRWRERWKMNS